MKTDMEEKYDKIYKYCYFHVHNSVLAEDLTQETFLRYLDRMAAPDCRTAEGNKADVREGKSPNGRSFLSGEKQLAYLYTIARNLCIDYFRKNSREVLGFGEEGVGEISEEKPFSGESSLVTGKIPGNGGISLNQLTEQLALRQAVLSLPKDLRELVALRFVQGESAQTVAEILGISRFSVYRREKQALKILRESLEEKKKG